MRNKALHFGLILLSISCSITKEENVGKSIITNWQGDKQSAISITYDDGTINQFTVARPIMNKLGLPGTFYIVTGKVEESAKGKFIGRPKEEIIQETASVKTNADNFFERASLIAYTGMKDAVQYNFDAHVLFDAGKTTEAYEVIDEAYQQVRNSKLSKVDNMVFDNNPEDTTTWEQYKLYTTEGHEIGSHTVTHSGLSVLDEANLLFELEQSKSDIEKFLGKKYTFSMDCGFSPRSDRVRDYVHQVYPALRSHMLEPYIDELDDLDERDPGKSSKEYVKWQRNPLTDVSMEVMKSWVDTSIAHDNIWLVLVFHGVDGIGWEPRTGADLEAYFSYIKEKQDQVWVATFADATKYVRERKNAKVGSTLKDDVIVVNFSSDLDPEVYDVPVTVKTYVPGTWRSATLTKKQDDQLTLTIQKDALGSYVLYSVLPGEAEMVLSKKV